VSTYFGVYRGTVANNVDPLTRARVQVSVPALGDGRLTWAEACSPYAGDGVGLVAVPPVGASVWVGFEGGDATKAVLLGGFWAGTSAPGDGLPTTKTLKTDGVTVTVSDLQGAGGLTIEVGPPAVSVAIKLACTSSGIELSIGSSKLVLSAASVSINDGALEVS
jgi:hypothetical protein